MTDLLTRAHKMLHVAKYLGGEATETEEVLSEIVEENQKLRAEIASLRADRERLIEEISSLKDDRAVAAKQELHEIADGAYGDGPFKRGLARTALTNRGAGE